MSRELWNALRDNLRHLVVFKGIKVQNITIEYPGKQEY